MQGAILAMYRGVMPDCDSGNAARFGHSAGRISTTELCYLPLRPARNGTCGSALEAMFTPHLSIQEFPPDLYPPSHRPPPIRTVPIRLYSDTAIHYSGRRGIGMVGTVIR